jgi:hypothetical protein
MQDVEIATVNGVPIKTTKEDGVFSIQIGAYTHNVNDVVDWGTGEFVYVGSIPIGNVPNGALFNNPDDNYDLWYKGYDGLAGPIKSDIPGTLTQFVAIGDGSTVSLDSTVKNHVILASQATFGVDGNSFVFDETWANLNNREYNIVFDLSGVNRAEATNTVLEIKDSNNVKIWFNNVTSSGTGFFIRPFDDAFSLDTNLSSGSSLVSVKVLDGKGFGQIL